ncbi:calcium homeostasis modulator protein 2-like [Suncus etruscus]|uniref:calcium homeostasis modulator protein 2-like n=1 Tax=Suncus etruscus TaxID=109475 RepID=UPI0021109A90|nr:calcium homeostasis modulator protein 2-like [Suncus etruscus]
MISNALLAMGTVGSEELYYWLTYQCPCASIQNYWYGLMTIVLPTLVLFIFSIILNNKTWSMGANCHSHKPSYTLQLLFSIVGKAAMVPVIWSIIMLLHGEAYICAFSEFVDPTSFSAGKEKFPVTKATQFLARFPCMNNSDPLFVFWEEVRYKLLRESQLLGVLLISIVAILMFLAKSHQYCCLENNYKHHYSASKEWKAIKMKERLKAANSVEFEYDFVVLNEKDENMKKKCLLARHVMPNTTSQLRVDLVLLLS